MHFLYVVFLKNLLLTTIKPCLLRLFVSSMLNQYLFYPVLILTCNELNSLWGGAQSITSGVALTEVNFPTSSIPP